MSQRLQSARYVPRQLDVLSDIKNILHKLHAGEDVAKPVVNLYGIAGIGKTFVLQQLFDECRHDYDILWIGFNLKDQRRAVGKVGFFPDLKRVSWSKAIALLKTLPGLEAQIGPQIMFDTQVSQPIDQLGDIMLAQALDHTPNRPLLLLLDSLDNLPYWRWLQERIINPLIDRQNTAIVCASQAELYWHFWEIREHSGAREPAPFNLEETRQFLGFYHADLLAETVHDLIGGYPLVLEQFAKLHIPSTITPSSTKTTQAQIEALSPDARTILEQVGIMRRAHVAVMQRLLGTISGNTWESPEQHRRLHLVLSEARANNLIRPFPDTFERFIPEVRQLVGKNLSLAEFLARCDIIAQHYYEIAYRHPKRETDALIEWLFFSTECFVAHSMKDRAAWTRTFMNLFDRVEQVAHEERIAIESMAHGSDYPELTNASIGSKIIASLYIDGELLQRLAKLGLLEQLHDRLLPLRTSAVPIRHDLRRASSNVFAELGKRIQAIGPPGMMAFETVLRNLLTVDGPNEFDQSELRHKLSDTWQSLRRRPARSLSEFITILTSSGLLLYDRDRRVYKFSPIVVHLLSVTPRDRFRDRSFDVFIEDPTS